MAVKRILTPLGMLFLGFGLGILARLFDIYTEHLGKMFSQMAIWILLGTLISIYSRTPKLAMENVFCFCIGMLLTYYAVAALTDGVYGTIYIIGWTAFGLCSPILAYFAWLTKGKGLFPKLIGARIVLVSVLSSVVLFDRLRFYDLVIDGLLVYVLFFNQDLRRVK